jgi:hypothetical protein
VIAVSMDHSGWRQAEQGLTYERFKVLAQLMLDLQGLGRGSTLVIRETGQPVLFVPVHTRRRSLAVLGCQEPDGGWSYLWDGYHKAAADGSMRAAHQIAAVEL